MRADSLGIFWRDEPAVRKLRTDRKVVPPEPTWLADDYLPGLERAKALEGIELLTDSDLLSLARNDELIFDIEVYRNYFLAAFQSYRTGKICFIEETLWEFADRE